MAELNDILQKITALSDTPEPYVLKRLINFLRVSEGEAQKTKDAANVKIHALIQSLKQNPHFAHGLTVFLMTLITKNHQMSLYTDTGILSDHSFNSSLMRLISHRFIPLLPENNSIIELVDFLFDQKDDSRWLASIDENLWLELIDLLKIDDDHLNLVATTKNNVLNAMVILSYRISGIGLHPDLIKFYPQMLDYSAAFVAQNQEAILFANNYREAHELDTLKDITPTKEIDPSPFLVMIEQCQDIVNTIRKRIYKTGISIHLTNMLIRLEQSLHRIQVLSELLSDNNKKRNKAILVMIQVIIISTKNRYSIRSLINKNTQLLSRKVAENSGRIGEHYISTDKSGYKKMFKKAAIGGFIIACLATLKILAYDLSLAPMGRAFVNSMIYGLGFVFIHIVHGTVATKQPAMTAAAIASTISDSTLKKSRQLIKLSELMVDIIRTQFIAIMGNVLLAMPIALLISYLWLQMNGLPIVSINKANHLLQDLNPFTSLALLHAAIAGVYLFLAGLIAGYYDNLAIFNHIGERIARHKLLMKIMPSEWAQRLGTFVENNLGALMSNFLFGVFLGSTATIGYLFGLPLDIRHIAFASANFVHGLFNLPTHSLTPSIIFISLLGVALIGIVNLLVSFSLAIVVALRSKGVEFSEWKNLSKLLFNHLIAQPKDFFIPRPTPMQYARLDSQGNMVYEETEKNKSNKFSTKRLAIRQLSSSKTKNKDNNNGSNSLVKDKKLATTDASNELDTKNNSSTTATTGGQTNNDNIPKTDSNSTSTAKASETALQTTTKPMTQPMDNMDTESKETYTQMPLQKK